MVLLKRKRSDSEISCSSSLISSPLSSSSFMAIDNIQNSISTPSLFSARTRKRHRDNRPSESDVHQHTLSLLYSAQQSPQSQFQSSLPSVLQTPVSSLPASNQSSTQQSSLHSFWMLPSARQSSPSSNSSTPSSNTPITNSAHNSYFEATNCEDCDASLNPGDNSDAMDVDMMMDIDTYGESGANHACSSCGKQVCHSCAISNLGAERKCLMCAGKKKQWVGGLGWIDME